MEFYLIISILIFIILSLALKLNLNQLSRLYFMDHYFTMLKVDFILQYSGLNSKYFLYL